MRVKICGITNVEDALNAVEAQADALGFVFAWSLRKINIDKASYILKSVPPYVNCVAVFVDQPVTFIDEVLKNCPFDTIQFHGNEEPHTLLHFKPQYRIIKTIHIKDEHSLKEIKHYKEADAFLLDTFTKEKPGGTGKIFDWSLASKLKEYNLNKPTILSGGLTPENVNEAINEVNPYAVDVSSGVEENPGKKSKKLIRSFVSNVKKKTKKEEN